MDTCWGEVEEEEEREDSDTDTNNENQVFCVCVLYGCTVCVLLYSSASVNLHAKGLRNVLVREKDSIVPFDVDAKRSQDHVRTGHRKTILQVHHERKRYCRLTENLYR